MSDWKNEDEIKAELRTLTQGLRQLREELRGLVTPPKPSPARALLHRQTWPAPTTGDAVAKAAGSQRQTWPAPATGAPVDKAADSTQKKPRKRRKK